MRSPNAPTPIVRWARWGVLCAAACIAAALAITAWRSYKSVDEASRTLARGQGELLLEQVNVRLRSLPRPPTKAGMASILSALSKDGLRYVGIHARRRVSAGEALGDPTTPIPREPGRLQMTRVGDRMRATHRLPPIPMRPPGARRGDRPPRGPGFDRPPRRDNGNGPPRPDFDRPPPPGDFGGPPPPGDFEGPPRPRPRPPIVIEFVPSLAQQMAARAKRSLLISGASAALLFLLGVFAFEWLRRREKLAEKLERERHLATLGEMSAVLAHEIRNPLASLKGHAQLLAESLPEDGRARAKADRVVTDAKRIETLTTDLLDFVKTGEVHPAPTDPSAVLQRASEMVNPDLVELDQNDAPGQWNMDAGRMEQVLGNLIKNAVEASPDGSRVSAKVFSSPNGLTYEVRDFGKGIPDDQLETIFQPFHTTRTRGTGLGLAVSRRIVELHGGYIEASNHPGGGALFRVLIP